MQFLSVKVWRLFALVAIAMVTSLLPAVGQDRLKGVALVIGQSGYEHIPALPNPAQDARDIAKLLTDLGFDARSVSDRDSTKLSRDIERFVEDAEGADVAFLYYAGHGIEAGGENWLVPTDADVASLSDAAARLTPVSDILKRLQETVPVTVVLLDACRTAPFPSDAKLKFTPTGSASPVSSSGLGVVRGAVALAGGKAASDNLGAVVGFAAEPGKPALDGAAGQNSPYAAALIRHLTAMKGAEFGQVMRMVTEEVYLDTKAAQRPWVSESLRRLLYFGVAPDEPTGTDADITGERRQLLLTISSLPDVRRRQIEAVAVQDAVPLDALYGVLRAMGDDKVPEHPDELAKALEEQAGRLKKLISDRTALRTDDPDTKTLLASADRAISEGALRTARALLDQAVARVEATSPAVDEAEELVRQKRIADAAIYARRAETSALAFDYAAASADYGKAFELIEKWDDKLRWNYKNLQAETLGKYGEFSGNRKALDDAVSAYEAILDMIPRSDDGRDVAITNNNLATILETIGERETGTQTLEKAVALYRQSLDHFSRIDDDANWSAAQSNVGNMLITIGERRGDVSMIEQAVEAHRAALARRDRTKRPYDWASSQNNLGLALYLLADKRGGGSAYDEAETAYRLALEEWTRAKYPAEWSLVLNNLGNTLNAQGNERALPEKFSEAAEAFRGALEVRTRETFPIAWASTRLNMGVSLVYMAKFSAGPQEIQQAVDLYSELLQVMSREVAPLDWASAQANYGSALQLLGQRTRNPEPVEQSVKAFTEARVVYTRENFPLDWAMTHFNSANSLRLLATLQGKPELDQQAVDAFRQSLLEYTRDRVPEQWAITQANLGAALQSIGDPESLRQSIEARRAALEVLTMEEAKIDWANAQSGLGMSLNNLGRLENTTKYFNEAESALIESLKVFTQAEQPVQWAFGNSNIGDVYWNRGLIDGSKPALETALRYFDLARSGFENSGAAMMVPLIDQKTELVRRSLEAK